MKTSIRIAVVVVALVATILFIRRGQKSKILLGNVKVKRPPKIKLKYSTNRKLSELPKLASSKDSYKVLKSLWSDQMELREEFVILLLNRANKVLGYHLLSQGGVNGTVADPKLIFATATQANASALILAHNHPSGNLKPSQADLNLTKKLTKAGDALDIAVLDHLILTKEGYYSFADEGLMV